MTIAGRRAAVQATDGAWASLAEPVLLAICQVWRFGQIEESLDRLTEDAERDLPHATISTLATFRDRHRLLALAAEVRHLLLDLPHFEGPATDPSRFVSSDRALSSYETLAETLDLEAWCEAIDDRAEAVEDTYASITEKLCEYRNFVRGATLEILILIVLVIEVGFQVYGLIDG